MKNEFGKMGDFEKISKDISEIEKLPLHENEDEHEAEMNDVTVPSLKKDVYVPSKNAPIGLDKDTAAIEILPGSAGTPAKNVEEQEPVLGSMGGYSATPSAKIEGFSENQTIDEKPQHTAMNERNSVDKVRDALNLIFDKKFSTPKTIQADLDASHPKNKVSEEPFTKMPLGW